MFHHMLCLLVIFAFLLASHQSTQKTVSQDGLVLQTDQSDYIAKYEKTVYGVRLYEFTLVARFENGAKDPVYLDRCYPDTPYPLYGIYAIEGGEVKESAYQRAWSCVGHDKPIVVQPGEIRTDKLRILGPGSWRSDNGTYTGSLEGNVRLVYNVRFCPEQPIFDVSGSAPKCKRPATYMQSDIFTVKLEK
jgi:hypothetical protein